VTQYSPFLDSLYNNQALTNLVSQIIGIDVIPHPVSLEHCHVNVQMPKKNNDLVFGWHYDSQPFVLIVMLSDVPQNAKGGGTLIQDRQGNVTELTFPEAGYGYVLQGSFILHAANSAENWCRATTITSYIPRDFIQCNEFSALQTTTTYTDHNVLAKQYFGYRLETLQKKIENYNNNYIQCPNNIDWNNNHLLQDLENIKAYYEWTMAQMKKLKDFKKPRPMSIPYEMVNNEWLNACFSQK